MAGVYRKMTETNQDFDLYQGDDKQVTFTVRDEAGAILDLTGYSAVWVMYNKLNRAATPILSKDTGGAALAILLPATQGKVRLTLEPSDSATVEPGEYPHELEITSGAGDVSTVTVGTVDLHYSKA